MRGGPIVVPIHVVDADHHAVRAIGPRGGIRAGARQLRHDHRAVAHVQLSAVIRNRQADREPEGIAQPAHRFADVGVRQFRNRPCCAE